VTIDHATNREVGAAAGADQGTDGAVSQAKEQAQQAAGDLKSRAADEMRSQLDTQSTRIGEQVSALGQALRRAAEHLDGEQNAAGAGAAHRAADGADRLAGYLSRTDANRLLADAERFARTRPWAAGAIGTAVGFIAARFVKASSEGRYETSRQAQIDADAPMRREFEETSRLGTSPGGTW
jgi:ElaB/YqjD/DUF883 family membrane-anchored ribosome-binding protein